VVLGVTNGGLIFDGAEVLIDAAGVRVDRSGVGWRDGGVEVVRAEQARALGTYIRQSEDGFERQLLLDIEIPLLGVGGPEIGVERRSRGRTDELVSLLLFGRRRRTERVRALALVRVRQRDVKDGCVEDVRLNEWEAIQADGRKIVVENAVPASHRCLAGAEQIVGETDAWGDVMPIGVEDVRRKLGIALEQ